MVGTKSKPQYAPGGGLSPRTRALGIVGLIVLGSVLFLTISLGRGGHMAGPTHITPGNVGLVFICRSLCDFI